MSEKKDCKKEKSKEKDTNVLQSEKSSWFDIQGDLDDFIFYGEDIKKCSER